MSEQTGPDLRPYPRSEKCVICGERDVDVISPADWNGQICWMCDAALINDERRFPVPTISEMLRYEEEALAALAAEPAPSETGRET